MANSSYDDILRTASRLFQERGYAGTSVRLIAEQSGIGKATIYHHFQDKEAIVSKLIEQSIDGFNSLISDLYEIEDSRSRLIAALEKTIDFLDKVAAVFQIVRRELPLLWIEIKVLLVPYYTRYISLLSESIEQGVASGIFRPIPPELAASVLLNLIQGAHGSLSISAKNQDSIHVSIQSMIDIYFNGIVNHTANL
ncbi:TetR/AcrR family transcriptional regulator [Paenibacillus solani]|uniref:TetR/AcrR family transcriptional regulator n=1 Tax=Paenibacillus solani TaxID=1705565 RepID=UPI003D2DFAA9